MQAVKTLQDLLTMIREETDTTPADLLGLIQLRVEEALDAQPLQAEFDGPVHFDFRGFTNARRGVDAVVKAILLHHGGEVRLLPSEVERARSGYDLVVTGHESGEVHLRTVER